MRAPTNQAQRPVAVWLGEDFVPEERRAIRALTVILRTVGCQWRKCTMCSFWQESAQVAQADVLVQMAHALQSSPGEEFILKIYTSGSFLDEREITAETRRGIAKMLREHVGLRKLIVETRPEFVTAAKLEDFAGSAQLEIAIGLETADEFIRSTYINKGFTFADYQRAAETVLSCAATVKTYLLLKPPWISEKQAIEDVVRSAERVSPYSSTISLNLCNIQRHAPLETLWQRGYYRPPWLWSALEALREIAKRELVVMSDPVGAGHRRGPHNCGNCDPAITAAIKRFNVTQDVRVLTRLDELECECRNVWRALMDRDACLFGSLPYLEGKVNKGARGL